MGLKEDLDWVRGKVRKVKPEAKNANKSLERVSRQLANRLGDEADFGHVRRLASKLWEEGSPIERRFTVRFLRRFGERLPHSFWELFRNWILNSKELELRDEISEWLVGSMVAADRTWLRVLRHWSEVDEKPLRRAGVLGALLRVRTMADVEAAMAIAEPLMRVNDGLVQEAVTRLLNELEQYDEVAVQEFFARWGRRGSSWAHPAVPRHRRQT